MRDRYIRTNEAGDRLFREWKEHDGKLIIAVDFDNTIFDCHESGDTYPRTIDIVKRAKDYGCHIMIFSASPEERYPFIREHCESIGISVDSINESPVILPWGNVRKPYYNLLLDDRAGLASALDALEDLLWLIDNLS